MTQTMRRRSLALTVLTCWLFSAAPAVADQYDPEASGHPLRIVAYVLHPVGVALDWLIFRPAHWIGSKEPLNTIFGHEDETPPAMLTKNPPKPPTSPDPAAHP